jgi:AraC-like DNA-binding protein
MEKQCKKEISQEPGSEGQTMSKGCRKQIWRERWSKPHSGAWDAPGKISCDVQRTEVIIQRAGVIKRARLSRRQSLLHVVRVAKYLLRVLRSSPKSLETLSQESRDSLERLSRLSRETLETRRGTLETETLSRESRDSLETTDLRLKEVFKK